MSTNAASWFYQQPEPNPYLITERLNATFWQARIVGLYWRADNATQPFHAFGYAGDQVLEMNWMPGQWVSLKVPDTAEDSGLPNGTKIYDLVNAISKRIFAMPANISFAEGQSNIVYEWHIDGGKHRWSEIQGKPGFGKPTRLINALRKPIGKQLAGGNKQEDFANPSDRHTGRMLRGGLICLLGIMVTAATYALAPRLGFYILAWGAVIFGGLDFVAGLIGSLTNR